MGKREKINQRTEGLYPSTINKVHHNGEGSQKPLAQGRGRGGATITTPTRMVDCFLQAACWLLRLSLLLYFFRTMELSAVKKKYLVGLAEGMSQNSKNWLHLMSACYNLKNA